MRSRRDTHLECQGFLNPTQGRSIHRSVRYICSGCPPIISLEVNIAENDDNHIDK